MQINFFSLGANWAKKKSVLEFASNSNEVCNPTVHTKSKQNNTIYYYKKTYKYGRQYYGIKYKYFIYLQFQESTPLNSPRSGTSLSFGKS